MPHMHDNDKIVYRRIGGLENPDTSLTIIELVYRRIGGLEILG